MKFRNKLMMILAAAFMLAGCLQAQMSSKMQLKISPDKRGFVENGKPFFCLGETGWLLFSKLNREEAIRFLDNRKEKGFNVIQVMVLHTVSAVNVYADT